LAKGQHSVRRGIVGVTRGERFRDPVFQLARDAEFRGGEVSYRQVADDLAGLLHHLDLRGDLQNLRTDQPLGEMGQAAGSGRVRLQVGKEPARIDSRAHYRHSGTTPSRRTVRYGPVMPRFFLLSELLREGYIAGRPLRKA